MNPFGKAPPSYANPDPHAVAIIGLSICAPGGTDKGIDCDEFYTFLKSRGSGIITVPHDRWNAEAHHGTGPGKICATKGGYIPHFSYGDLQEFGITPAEGAQVDINQTVLLHQTFKALQRSGVDYRGSKTGVYVGCTRAGSFLCTDITQAGAYYMTGSALAITANRINYVFDLLGPSMPVDTACSSSLTAMHLAVQALRNGDCDLAVVAGVNFIGTAFETASFSQLGVLSPDGVSKSFDEDANGYARADVASAVVIKRHDLAVRDLNRIHATLVGTALTSCGSIMGSLTTPSPEAQANAIRMAYSDAGLEPHQADFVELHGTGTIVGDSIESNTAGSVFSKCRQGREILIGSVKSNVGHGEMGAYMSSLVKVVMMLENKTVLPNGNFKKPSRRVEFEKYKLRVPVEVENFVPHDATRGLIASISSFGFGGSCGHTVLREHEPRPVREDLNTLQKPPFLFSVGGLSPKGCNSLVAKYKEECRDTPVSSLCEHMGNFTRQMPWRTYAIADSIQMADFADPVLVPKRQNPLVFCFSGQGPQHWEQGRDLFLSNSVFRNSILECDRVHLEYSGKSFLEETCLFLPNAPETSPLLDSSAWSQGVISVAICYFQIAFFDLLLSLGLKPDVVVGHSMGETAVLYVSGAMPRDMVIKIAIARGKALDTVDNIGGAMVSVSGCDEGTLRRCIEDVFALASLEEAHSEELYLASYNTPTDIGVSGTGRLVDALVKFAGKWMPEARTRKLRMNTAPHSPFVEACEEKYRRELTKFFGEYPGNHTPTIPTVSTVTGDFNTDSYSVDYMWRNIRQPVLFSKATSKIIETLGERVTFVEISPHPVLSGYIKRLGAFDSIASHKNQHHKPKDPGFRTEFRTLLEALGRLLTLGFNRIDFSRLNGYPGEPVRGPAYPFQWKFCPFSNRQEAYLQQLLPPTRPLNSKRLRISPSLPEPWMSQHVIDHSNLIPAAAYLEMALEFPGVTHVWDCSFEAVHILDETAPASTLEVSMEGQSWWVKSSSALVNQSGDIEWSRSGLDFDTTHSSGKLGYGVPEADEGCLTHVDVEAVLSRCTHMFDHAELYAELEGIAQFGPEFKRINRVAVNTGELVSWIRGHTPDIKTETEYVFYPAVMDGVFQSFLGWSLLYEKVYVRGKDRTFWLPHSLRYAFRNDGSTDSLILPEEFLVYAVLVSWSPQHWIIDLYVLGDGNSVLFTFKGLEFQQTAEL